MRIIKANETMRYADEWAYMPVRQLDEGVIYTSDDLSDYIIDTALRIGAAEQIEPEFDDNGELIRETKVIKPESKEKRMKGKTFKK